MFVQTVVLTSWMALGPQNHALSTNTYEDQLHGMWLGQIIANWTGLRTEIQVNNPPFLTDDDWGGDVGRGTIEFVIDQDPWLADDDTDIEYVYVHSSNFYQTTALSSAQIWDGWNSHIDRFIWVSNERANELMEQGYYPPATGMSFLNRHTLMIDAQLTTEVFGAFAPGSPVYALEIADLPIRTTASSFAAHAAQFHVILYSLAALIPQELPPKEMPIWIIDEATGYIPDESKVRDILSFVRQDFITNPDKNDWEKTRDRIYGRYQQKPGANGFVYRGEFESAINFAAGIMALLYGQGDYKRTVQIGTLAGWDSDNPTATMGGLLGLIYGYDYIVSQFPETTLSDRFQISRTRDFLPDYLPSDGEAEDTLLLLSKRMIPLVKDTIRQAGGRVENEQLYIPYRLHNSTPAANPLYELSMRDQNLQSRLSGGKVGIFTSHLSDPENNRGSSNPSVMIDSLETDFRGIESLYRQGTFYSTEVDGNRPDPQQYFAITYDVPKTLSQVLFIEGPHYQDGQSNGGWIESIDSLQVLTNLGWENRSYTLNEPLEANRPGQYLVFSFVEVQQGVFGVRLNFQAGGTDAFVTCTEFTPLE